jgi:hypothetical protein
MGRVVTTLAVILYTNLTINRSIGEGSHGPRLTGGCGQAKLREFYATHFILRMPPDMEMVPVSRTIGSDQLVDEMVIKFTHSLENGLDVAGIPRLVGE